MLGNLCGCKCGLALEALVLTVGRALPRTAISFQQLSSGRRIPEVVVRVQTCRKLIPEILVTVLLISGADKAGYAAIYFLNSGHGSEEYKSHIRIVSEWRQTCL